MFSQLKDNLYYYLAEKNRGISREYYPYLDAHPEIKRKRSARLMLLFRLNWHYRGLRRREYLFPELEEQQHNFPKTHTEKAAELSPSECERALQFAEELLRYDVISFDIFDTLIFRPFAKPTDLFTIVGERLNQAEYKKIRIDAERLARERAFLERKTREVNIYEIYSIIEERTGIPKDFGIKTELETEFDYCFANPFMMCVFSFLLKCEKTIIITSDMYLPHDMMAQLLTKTGYNHYDNLYVSCDYGFGKHNVKLYQYISKEYPGKTIVHIGDNNNSDIECAKKAGWETRFYQYDQGLKMP